MKNSHMFVVGRWRWEYKRYLLSEVSLIMVGSK